MKHENGGFTYLWNEEFSIWRKISMNFRPFSPVRRASHVHRASVNLHWKISPSASRSLYAPHLFAGAFWKPSLCPNWVHNSSLERDLSLNFNPTVLFQFGVHFPYHKSKLPRLVKMCQMMLPQGRVLLQSTFEGVPQLQSELMIAHWKAICVWLSFYTSFKSFC